MDYRNSRTKDEYNHISLTPSPWTSSQRPVWKSADVGEESKFSDARLAHQKSQSDAPETPGNTRDVVEDANFTIKGG